jgi:hypothetical protein
MLKLVGMIVALVVLAGSSRASAKQRRRDDKGRRAPGPRQAQARDKDPRSSRDPMNETRALARFVTETKFADLPRGLVDNRKIAVLDAIGAEFVGAV